MKNNVNYEKETRSAYRNPVKAKAYKEQYTRGIKWARFTIWRGQVILRKALKICNLTESDQILDIPCGTGVSAHTLSKISFVIIASDISREMMNLAREDYQSRNFKGFIQADITKPPFNKQTFACIVMLGFMHRAPADIRAQTLAEMASLSKKFLIVSYAVDSLFQRLKQQMIKMARPTHRPAPSPVPLRDIFKEFHSHGFIVRKKFNIVWLLCSHSIFLLEKSDNLCEILGNPCVE